MYNVYVHLKNTLTTQTHTHTQTQTHSTHRTQNRTMHTAFDFVYLVHMLLWTECGLAYNSHHITIVYVYNLHLQKKSQHTKEHKIVAHFPVFCCCCVALHHHHKHIIQFTAIYTCCCVCSFLHTHTRTQNTISSPHIAHKTNKAPQSTQVRYIHI